MNQKRSDLLDLIDSSNPVPSLPYWNSILNFFERNYKDLNIHDMEIICTESERCRLYWNTKRSKIVKILKAGKYIDQEIIIESLNIKKEDINPPIYNHLEFLYQEEIRHEEEHQEENKSTPSKHSSEVIPMAAAAKD